MKKFCLLFFVFTVITVVITWPLVLNLNSLIIDKVDGLLITWFLNWSIIHPLNYNANIFFPYARTLAFSETMLPQALLIAPVIYLFKEPLLAFNINFLTGFVFTALSAYYLTFQLTKRSSTSFLVSILLTFSTIHLNYMAHLQLFNLYPVILATLFLLRQNKKLFVLFFVISSLTTVLFFYFLLIFCLWKKRFTWLLTAVILTMPFLTPYFLVAHQFNYQRPITDAINFSLQIPDLANVSVASRLNYLIPQIPNSTPAYFGGAFLILLLIMFWKKTRSNAWLVIGGVSFILALGPALHIFRHTIHIGPIPAIPLPYTILYYLIPGFSGLRTPSRWILLTVISLGVAVGLYFSKKITWRWAIILSILVLAEVNFPFHYYEIPKPPPEQIWLKSNYVGAPIIQFPIYSWFDGDKIEDETLREYYSTIHWHPMFNGYSGYSPTEWENKVKWLQKEFPSMKSVTYLRNLGIKLVLAPSSWQIPLKSVADFPNIKIYEIY